MSYPRDHDSHGSIGGEPQRQAEDIEERRRGTSPLYWNPDTKAIERDTIPPDPETMPLLRETIRRVQALEAALIKVAALCPPADDTRQRIKEIEAIGIERDLVWPGPPTDKPASDWRQDYIERLASVNEDLVRRLDVMRDGGHYLRRLFRDIAPTMEQHEDWRHFCIQIDNYIAGLREQIASR